MGPADYVVSASAAISALSTLAIAWMSYSTLKSAKGAHRLAEEAAVSARESEQRFLEALEYLAAASLAGGITGGSIAEGTRNFKDYLAAIRDEPVPRPARHVRPARKASGP